MEKSEFYITLLSNASYDIFPDNSIYHFTNVLKNELYLPPSEKWQVCLRSISVASVLDSEVQIRMHKGVKEAEQMFHNTTLKAKTFMSKNNANQTSADRRQVVETLYKSFQDLLEKKNALFNKRNRLFIECNEISHKFGTSKVLSSFLIPVNDDSGSGFITYEPTTEEYFDLISPTINSFSIQIHNNDRDLTSNAAQPTIIGLKFKKMEKETMEYHTMNVTNDSDNQTSFLTAFPDRLVKDGKQNSWEMAITRIGLVPLFQMYPKGVFNVFIVQNYDDKLDALTNTNWDTFMRAQEAYGNIQNAQFTYKQDATWSTQVEALRDYLTHICRQLSWVLDLKTVNNRISITFYKKNVPTSKTTKDELLLVLPIEMLTVLGLDVAGVIYKDGYGALHAKLKKKITGIRDMNTDVLQPKNLLIYTDCVRSSLIGNVYGQYLTNIPVILTEHQDDITTFPYLNYEPKNLEFHPITSSDMNNVRFTIYKSNGEEAEFSINNIRLFMSLLFRRKIK